MSNKEREDSHWRKVLKTTYLSGDEVDGELLVTIEDYESETFFSPSTRSEEEHTILKIKEFKKGIILNTRKAKQITTALKSKYMLDWIGKTVTLFTKREKHFGVMHDVITFKRGVRVLPTLDESSDKWESAKSALRDGKTTIEAIKKSYTLTSENQLKLEDENNS